MSHQNVFLISESTPLWTSALTCMWSASRGCILWHGALGFIRSRRTLCTSSRRCSGPCSSWWAQITNLRPCDWATCVRQSRFSPSHADSWWIQSDVDPDWHHVCFPHRCYFHLPLVSSVQLTSAKPNQTHMHHTFKDFWRPSRSKLHNVYLNIVCTIRTASIAGCPKS